MMPVVLGGVALLAVGVARLWAAWWAHHRRTIIPQLIFARVAADLYRKGGP